MTKAKWIALLVTLIAAAGILLYAAVDAGVVQAMPPRTVEVRNIFVDVNQDGLLDLILEGDVILNESPLAGAE